MIATSQTQTPLIDSIRGGHGAGAVAESKIARAHLHPQNARWYGQSCCMRTWAPAYASPEKRRDEHRTDCLAPLACSGTRAFRALVGRPCCRVSSSQPCLCARARLLAFISALPSSFSNIPTARLSFALRSSSAALAIHSLIEQPVHSLCLVPSHETRRQHSTPTAYRPHIPRGPTALEPHLVPLLTSALTLTICAPT